MNRDAKKLALPFFAPALLLAAAFALADPARSLPRAVLEIGGWAPFVLCAVGAAMALWFQRRSMVFPFAFLALAYGLLHGLFPGPPGDGPLGQVVYAGLCVLLPVNLAAYAFLGEKGLWSLHGAARLAAALVQIALVAAAAGADAWMPVAEALHARVFDKEFDYWTYLPQPALLLFGTAVTVLLVRLLVTRQPLDGGLLGATAASWAALHMVGRGGAPALFMTVAALALITALVQEAYRMAFLDELTGLPARRALMGLLKTLSGKYVIAMLDVDHFKSFNDTYGHDVGDQVLRMVATRMEKVTGGGRPFRYGGEEFTVVFPGKSKAEAKVHLDALREAIASSSFRLRSPDRPEEKPEDPPRKADEAETVGVTISIGYAEKTRDLDDPTAVIKAADEALYRAKEGGRNRVAA